MRKENNEVRTGAVTVSYINSVCGWNSGLSAAQEMYEGKAFRSRKKAVNNAPKTVGIISAVAGVMFVFALSTIAAIAQIF
jgi:hypothetical protein